MDFKITFIGAGNMASSLVGGLIKRGLNPSNITMSDPNTAQLDNLQQTFGIQAAASNEAAWQGADVVILAVKPQVMKTVVTALQGAAKTHQPLVISIAAGITITHLTHWLGGNLAVVRCMPNTPALVQTGATGMFANPCVSTAQRDLATEILGAVGITCWTEQENDLDAVTAISGSGPAYFFLVMEAMIAAGQKLGLSQSMSEALTIETALGAAKMAKEGVTPPEILRKQVTSPGGTTEAALKTLEAGKLRQLFEEALTNARERSRELAAD